MKNKTAMMLTGIVALAVTLGIYATGHNALTGIFIGFLTGLFNVQWLFKDASKAIGQDLTQALRIYYKGLFSRLGMITLVVVMVWRYQADWLFYLALGIAGGIIIPLILAIRQQILHERG